MFKKGQTCVTDAEYTGHSFDVNEQWETELQKPQISKIESGVLL